MFKVKCVQADHWEVLVVDVVVAAPCACNDQECESAACGCSDTLHAAHTHKGSVPQGPVCTCQQDLLLELPEWHDAVAHVIV